MRMGKVIGRVTLSKQDPAYTGGRWLMVNPLDRAQLRTGDYSGLSAELSCVVYDDLGAGVGDLVGFVDGAEATAPFDHPMPIDAYNCALINRIEYMPPPA